MRKIRRHRGPARRRAPVPRESGGHALHRLLDMRLPFGPQLLADIRNRTETAIPQARTLPGDAAGDRGAEVARWVDARSGPPAGQGAV